MWGGKGVGGKGGCRGGSRGRGGGGGSCLIMDNEFNSSIRALPVGRSTVHYPFLFIALSLHCAFAP